METLPGDTAQKEHVAFKSHHSGMETMALVQHPQERREALNRTIVGWKLALVGADGRNGGALNRTIVGWKRRSRDGIY